MKHLFSGMQPVCAGAFVDMQRVTASKHEDVSELPRRIETICW